MIDYHIHSNISTDATDPMQVLVEAAEKKGLKEICFTEHMDLDYPFQTKHNWCSDMQLYDKAIKSIKVKGDLKVKKGIEVGLKDGVYDRLNDIIDNNGLDFVIASQHLIGDEDPYFPEYYIGKDQKSVYESYLLEIFNKISAFDNFDVVGHIGYIVRFVPYKDVKIEFLEFLDIIDEILKSVISRDKGIELNTIAFSKFKQSLPALNIIKRYYELGGEIITIGSDAHTASRVGDKNKWAMELLKDVGFKYITIFNKRQKSFLKL
ncbi:MAG: histidinol-phosphatase HisJ family protein [Eubacteriales bacterium]